MSNFLILLLLVYALTEAVLNATISKKYPLLYAAFIPKPIPPEPPVTLTSLAEFVQVQN